MTVIEKYKQWKKDNPDESYQYDMLSEFIAELSREELQAFLEMVVIITSDNSEYKKCCEEIETLMLYRGRCARARNIERDIKENI